MRSDRKLLENIYHQLILVYILIFILILKAAENKTEEKLLAFGYYKS